VRAVLSPAFVRASEPALDRYVVCRYEAEAGAARLRFESNAPGRGRLRVLLPGGARPLRALSDGVGGFLGGGARRSPPAATPRARRGGPRPRRKAAVTASRLAASVAVLALLGG